MKTKFALTLIAAALSAQAFAAETPAARYAEDKKLCAEESSSSARMQCLRDAKAEYNKALAESKATAKATTTTSSTTSSKTCQDCGKVTSVKVEEKEGEGGPLGTIAGGVAGALVGNQVGQGTGKDLATIAGAVGGAYAGHKIEGKVKSTKVWVVTVHFNDGEAKTYHFDHDPGFATGTAVKASGETIVRR
ncbi:MAG TPA: glycine zipper 2TM domain-containing protein [Rhodocyclaceae bacterium]|nr:glycine zipper 2TM domain-containing protein [Rhodocyclaceae bacterium]